jgi:hypothetical protein
MGARVMVGLWSHIRFRHRSAVVPQTFLLLLDSVDGWLAALRLIESNASHAMDIVASERDPLPPLTRAFPGHAKEADPDGQLTRRLGRLGFGAAPFSTADESGLTQD